MAERFTDEGQPAGIGGTAEFRTDVFDPPPSTPSSPVWPGVRIRWPPTLSSACRVSMCLMTPSEHAQL